MAVDELAGQLDTRTTRRTVVKTGVKLAYAAPLVAATMKLSGQHAGASPRLVSHPGAQICSPEGGFGNCSNTTLCGGTDGFNTRCTCLEIADGGGLGACVNVNFSCGAVNHCTSTAVCVSQHGAGWVCAKDDCCGDPICLPPCGVNP